MAEKCDANDWTGNWRSLALIWGVPIAIIIGSGDLNPLFRGLIWTLTLLWMSAACFLNARRCNRTHCRYTGPYFLLMAVLVALYTVGAIPLGSNGRTILANISLGGALLLCFATEWIWGRYQH